jgi:hypothetical protein
MRMQVVAMIAVFSLAGTAAAQDATNGSPPKEIGNRANGYDYQPTPNEIRPREKAAGILPSTAQQQAEDRELARIDKHLLESEGLSTSSAPKQ